MSKSLPIKNCADCPHMKKITSPYTGDPFDMADEDAICTHPKVEGAKENRGAHNTVRGRMICASERWWKPAHTAIPKWCPLEG